MRFRQVAVVKVPPRSIAARRRFIEYHARRGATTFLLSGRSKTAWPEIVEQLEERGWSAYDSREHDGYHPNQQTGHIIHVHPKEH